MYPDSKVQEAYMGPTWGRQDPGGTHVGPMNLAIRVMSYHTGPHHNGTRLCIDKKSWITQNKYLVLTIK